jgi:hypothetical protein
MPVQPDDTRVIVRVNSNFHQVAGHGDGIVSRLVQLKPVRATGERHTNGLEIALIVGFRMGADIIAEIEDAILLPLRPQRLACVYAREAESASIEKSATKIRLATTNASAPQIRANSGERPPIRRSLRAVRMAPSARVGPLSISSLVIELAAGQPRDLPSC